MNNERKLLFLTTLFMVYTQGFWERILSLPSGTTLICEIPIWLYLSLSYKSLKKTAPGFGLVAVYFCVVLVAGFANESSVVSSLKYMRFFIYFYLIFQSLWNSYIPTRQWFIIFKFLIVLVLLQGGGAAFNLFILNQRIEGQVGLLSSLGGSTASTFLLLIISLSPIFYIFSLKQGWKFYFLIVMFVVAATLVGYQSGKRAIFFTGPTFVLASIIISYLQLRTNADFYKKNIVIGILLVLLFPIFIYGVTTSRGLNYNLKGNESSLEVIVKAIDYSEVYEGSTTKYGHTTGRSGTSAQVIKKSTEDLNSFLFGDGYGAIKDSKTLFLYKIGYGIVGFTRDILSGGWIVMILTVLILSKVILVNRSAPFKCTKAVRQILFGVFLFTHFAYSSDFTVHLKVNLIVVILCVFINAPIHKQSLVLVVKKFFHPAVEKKKIRFVLARRII